MRAAGNNGNADFPPPPPPDQYGVHQQSNGYPASSNLPAAAATYGQSNSPLPAMQMGHPAVAQQPLIVNDLSTANC